MPDNTGEISCKTYRMTNIPDLEVVYARFSGKNSVFIHISAIFLWL